MSRLSAVQVGTGTPETVVAALRSALDGTGPAVLPVPSGAPEGVRAALLAATRPDDAAAPLECDDVVLVVPTSGSTGAPKGALLTRTAVLASARATAARLSGPGLWVLALPLSHVAGLMVVARAHLVGESPVVGAGSAGGFDSDVLATATTTAARRAEQAGLPLYTALVPTQLDRLLDAGVDMRAYDAILLGAAAAPAGLVARARDAGARVVTTYGMTETCGGCVYDGVPLDGVQVRTEDDGRVLLGGPTLAAGYRLRPELSAASFVDGWFRTGDLGRWDGARLDVLGRLDDVIVSGGEKVVPGVVEAALESLTPADPATRWCVVGVEDPEWGQRVVAVVAGSPVPSTQPLGQLRERLRATLPAAWLPRAVVHVDALPLLATGKVDRAAATRLAASA